MTYITDDELADLPNEPEQRFVALEGIVRERYEKACCELDQNDSELPLQRRYMSVVLAAAKYCNIAELSRRERPLINDDNWKIYNQFMADVDFAIMELRLRGIDQATTYSVAIDPAGKVKLRHLLEQIRDTVDQLDISIAKKERLFACIQALRTETERDRTRWQMVGTLIIEACDDVGEAANRLKPVVRLIERVSAALGVAKRNEEAQEKLPAPRKQKQIEPPKRNPSSWKNKAEKSFTSSYDKSIDDKIPF